MDRLVGRTPRAVRRDLRPCSPAISNIVEADHDIYPTTSNSKNALVQAQSRLRFRTLLIDQGWDGANPHAGSRRAYVHVLGLHAKPRLRDAGLRLDHLLLSAKAARRFSASGVDRGGRGEDGASDHAPAWAELRDTAQRFVFAKAEGPPGFPDSGSRRARGEQATTLKRSAAASCDQQQFFRPPLLAPWKHGRQRRARTGALGSANLLLRLYQGGACWSPGHVKAPTYRHEDYADYQSGHEFDDDLVEQVDTHSAIRDRLRLRHSERAGPYFLAARAAAEEARAAARRWLPAAIAIRFQLASAKTTIRA